jgi:hypothetical protein
LGLAEYLEIAGNLLADNAQGQVESRAVTGIDYPRTCEALRGRLRRIVRPYIDRRIGNLRRHMRLERTTTQADGIHVLSISNFEREASFTGSAILPLDVLAHRIYGTNFDLTIFEAGPALRVVSILLTVRAGSVAQTSIDMTTSSALHL